MGVTFGDDDATEDIALEDFHDDADANNEGIADLEGGTMDCGNENIGMVRNLKSQIGSFVWERKKAIVFRFLSFIAIGLDVYTITKKYIRGHILWVIASIVLLIIPPILGSLYSLWCTVQEAWENPDDESPTKRAKVKSQHDHDTKGYQDNMITIDESDEPTESEKSVEEKSPKPKKVAKKNSAITFTEEVTYYKSGAIPKKKGTHVEPLLINPKNTDEEDEELPELEKSFSMPLRNFLPGITRHCSVGMILSHIFLVPKEYRFWLTSSILWKHLKEPHFPDCEKALNKMMVKKVCYSKTWNEYCYSEIISKQISLLIATFQTVPMTIMDLLYWTIQSEEISKKTKSNSFFNLTNLGGEQFNIVEVVSILVNMIKVSYHLVSLLNQIRKIDFARQDLKFLHNVYLTLIYFLILCSRVSSLYWVMSINQSGIMLTIIIMVIQFTLLFTITKDLIKRANRITLLISNMLMLFIYVPPKSKRKLSFSSYHIIQLLEMIGMFVFGHLQVGSVTQKYYVVGNVVPIQAYYYGYAFTLATFTLGVLMNIPQLQINLFSYNLHMKRDHIRSAIHEVNKEHGTDLSIIIGNYGQEQTSYSAARTIHLF